MHPKNRYANPHDFTALSVLEPELGQYLTKTPDGRITLDFSAPRAVYLLNRTLLLRDYHLKHWDIPRGNLTPPIPGRLDYVHALADLVPDARRVLDIGCGASLIYPILGSREYGWSVVGSEVDPKSIRIAEAIIKFNRLRGIEVRRQYGADKIFSGVIDTSDTFDATLCNPPFFDSRAAAEAAAVKKWNKLGIDTRALSFGGTASELHTPGGQPRFLYTMIEESRDYAARIGWFTTLVSRGGYLRAARQQLQRVKAAEVRTLPLAQGNKAARVLAWRF